MKELNVTYLLRLALKRWIVLVAAFVVFAGTAFVFYRYIVTPSYTAQTSLMITSGGMLFGSQVSEQQQQSANSANINSEFTLSVNMMKTYVEYLRAPEIYNDLAKKWAEDFPNETHYDGKALREFAKISARGAETFLLDITFTTSDPHLSARLASRFSECALKNLEEVFPYLQAEPIWILTDKSVGDRAGMDEKMIMFLSGLVGAAITFGIVLLIDFTDHAIAGEEGYAAHFEVPLLGVVPYFESDVSVGSQYKRGGYYYSEYGKNQYK